MLSKTKGARQLARYLLITGLAAAAPAFPRVGWTQQPARSAAPAAEARPDAASPALPAGPSGSPLPLAAPAAATAPSPPAVLRAEARLEVLEQQLRQLEAKLEEQELEQLRQQADTASTALPEQQELTERTFVTAARSLQMLNPEISVGGELIADLLAVDGGWPLGSSSRTSLGPGIGVHVQSSLDPFSQAKAALEFDPQHGAVVEEVYVTWAALLPSLSLTMGRFRHQLGVLHRWHEHDLDQTSYPLMITRLLGKGGLVATGLSLRWLMPPLLGHASELTLEVSDGRSSLEISGEQRRVPSTLARWKNYWDLSDSTYVELGFSGLQGFDDCRYLPAQGFTPAASSTWGAAADLTLFWQPPQRAKYRSLTWRSEGLWLRRELAGLQLDGWGAYSYLQWQLDSRWFVGLRGDLVSPLEQGSPERVWAVVPYLTFWQSEFVYLRLEVMHGDRFAGKQGPAAGDDRETRVVLQLEWAAGPHKHEKY